MLSTIREQWFSNIRGDVLAGIVVALALIPEAIAFSIIAGVDPKVGLCFILYCRGDFFRRRSSRDDFCCNWCYGFINGHTG